MHINLMVIYILTVFFHLKLHRRIVDILNNVDKEQSELLEIAITQRDQQ